jgi:predicted metalloendopeptidase
MAPHSKARARTVLSLLMIGTLAACNDKAPVKESGAAGIDLGGIDRSVAPGADFFRYANGTWLKTTEIPADRSTYGNGAALNELTTKRVAELIRNAGAGNPVSADARKVADYFASFMDEAAIEAKGLTPLKDTLDRIATIEDRRALSRVLGSQLRTDVDALNATDIDTDQIFGLWIAQDLEDPSRYIPFLLQGGLDLPDRSYYLDNTPRMEEIRGKLLTHIANVLRLAGVKDAETRAKGVFELERRIAEAHATRADSDDIQKANNHWARKRFDTDAPGLDWNAYFQAAGLADNPDFVVWQPGAVEGISALVGNQPIQTWKDYLLFHAIEHSAAVLTDAIVKEHFAFHGMVLAGIPQQRERWKRAVAATNAALGEAVGKLYVERYFPASAKARIATMVDNIRAAFARRIDALEWMTPPTKERAKAKLAVLEVGVGYPDQWIDYRDLEVIVGDAFGNAERAELFDYRRNLQKLGKPVNRKEWVMTPQTVNAVNLPVMNAMNFPAAILQSPFFDAARPIAMDYGSIGAIIGHEISHSFDDLGAQFDDTGKLRNWWTPADLAQFQRSGQQLARQYDQYKPFPDLSINGSQTLSENIADVAGLSAAFDAYHMSLGGKPAAVVAGLSGDQQFFLSFAQSWRSKAREPALRQQVIVDAHAPGPYRALTVRNLDGWYAAFDVKPGQALYLAPQERVRMW